MPRRPAARQRRYTRRVNAENLPAEQSEQPAKKTAKKSTRKKKDDE